MNDRAKIVKLLGEHKDALGDMRNLIALFHRTVEDLVAAGLDRSMVADAAFTAAATAKLTAEGKDKAIHALRSVADYFENELGDRPYPDEPRH